MDADLTEEHAMCVEAGGARIALFRRGCRIWALADSCAHRGGPLSEGHVDGEEVICPWHAWGFELRTGKCSTVPGVRQRSYPVRVEKGEVWVDVEEKA